MHAAFAAADINRDTFQFLPKRSWRGTMHTTFSAADINRYWDALQISLYIALRGQEGSCQYSQFSDDRCWGGEVEGNTAALTGSSG